MNPDFRDILFAFSEEKVDYMVVGAYALAFHGFPRATGDIDLWIRCSDDNAECVWRALGVFGAPLFDLTLDDLKTPGMVFQIGIAPCRIDILTSIGGVEFAEAELDRKEVEFMGLRVPVIGRTHLLRSKRAAARPKDLADIAWLESQEG